MRAKSGVEWEPLAHDEYGKITAVRINADEAQMWEVVQIVLDASEYRIA